MTSSNDLELLKNELIDTLDNYSYYPEYFSLISLLIKGTDADDLDFAEVLEDGTAFLLVDLLLDCFDSSDFLQWLEKMKYDIFRDYRFSNRAYRSNETDEEWEEICDDALICNDTVAVLSFDAWLDVAQQQ